MNKDQGKMEKINARPDNEEERNEMKKQKVEEEKVKKDNIASHFQTVDKKIGKRNKQMTKSIIKNSGRTENEI